LGDTITASAQPRRARKVFIARQPMGRLATAEEIAETFVYLVSDESSFMTGHWWYVTVGMSLKYSSRVRTEDEGTRTCESYATAHPDGKNPASRTRTATS